MSPFEVGDPEPDLRLLTELCVREFLEEVPGPDPRRFLGGVGDLWRLLGGVGDLCRFLGGVLDLFNFLGGVKDLSRFLDDVGDLGRFLGGVGDLRLFLGGIGDRDLIRFFRRAVETLLSQFRFLRVDSLVGDDSDRPFLAFLPPLDSGSG